MYISLNSWDTKMIRTIINVTENSLSNSKSTQKHTEQKTAVHYTCVCLFVLYCAGLYT